MIKPMLECELSTEEEIRQYEKDWDDSAVFERKRKETADRLVELANSCLNKKQECLPELHKLVTSSVYQDVKTARKDELIILERMCKLAMEEKSGSQTILKFKSVQQIWDVYYQAHFYLRRIEQKLPKHFCNEIIPFILEWQLTPEYFLMVIQGGFFVERVKVGYALGELLIKNGYSQYGQTIWEKVVQMYENGN